MAYNPIYVRSFNGNSFELGLGLGLGLGLQLIAALIFNLIDHMRCQVIDLVN